MANPTHRNRFSNLDDSTKQYKSLQLYTNYLVLEHVKVYFESIHHPTN